MSEEWATAPLLDERNVGKLVWVSHNSNRAEPVPITKIGRTNVHVGRWGRPSSLRVDDTGDIAHGMENSFSVTAYTNARRMSDEVRREFSLRLNRTRWARLSVEQLAAVVGLLDEMGVSE